MFTCFRTYRTRHSAPLQQCTVSAGPDERLPVGLSRRGLRGPCLERGLRFAVYHFLSLVGTSARSLPQCLPNREDFSDRRNQLRLLHQLTITRITRPSPFMSTERFLHSTSTSNFRFNFKFADWYNSTSRARMAISHGFGGLKTRLLPAFSSTLHTNGMQTIRRLLSNPSSNSSCSEVR